MFCSDVAVEEASCILNTVLRVFLYCTYKSQSWGKTLLQPNYYETESQLSIFGIVVYSDFILFSCLLYRPSFPPNAFPFSAVRGSTRDAKQTALLVCSRSVGLIEDGLLW